MSQIKAYSIEGNQQKLDGGSMFGNAPRALWEKWAKPDEQSRISLACRCLLIELNNKKILFETGIGAFFEPKMAERFGVQNPDQHLLLENLKSWNIDHKDIDYVVLSHLHFDHAGGLLPKYSEIQNGNDDLLFPNAIYVIGKEAWERAQNPHFRDRASFVPKIVKKLQETDRKIIISSNSHKDFFPDQIHFFTSDGHTPGQLHSLIKGENSNVVFCGDLIPGSHWVHLPITMGYDRFPEKLIEEKQELYEKMDLNKTFFFFTHDTQMASAKIAKDEKGKYSCTETFNKWESFLI